MSNKLRYASPPDRLSKINLLCKQRSSRIIADNGDAFEAGGTTKNHQIKCLIIKISQKIFRRRIYRKSSYRSVSFDFLGIMSKYEKDRETFAVQKSLRLLKVKG